MLGALVTFGVAFAGKCFENYCNLDDESRGSVREGVKTFFSKPEPELETEFFFENRKEPGPDAWPWPRSK